MGPLSLSRSLCDILRIAWGCSPGPFLLRLLRGIAGHAVAAALPGGVASFVLPKESGAWERFGIDGSERSWRLEVLAGPKGMEIASLWDFDVQSAEPLEFPLEQLLRDKAGLLSPYSYEDGRGCLLLIEAKEGADVSRGSGFFYQSQVANAARVYVVPEEEFVSAVDAAVPAPRASQVLSRAALLHSTGRCGSTLLSKILDGLGSTISFNEPDIYSCLCLAQCNLNPEDEPGRQMLLGRLARASTLLLVAGKLATLPADEADTAVVWVKVRGFVVHIAKLMKAHMPEARNVYLYRNAIDYTDSACSAFLKAGPMPYMRMMGLDGYIMWKTKPPSKRLSPPAREGNFQHHVKEVVVGKPENFRPVFGIGFVGSMGLHWQANIFEAWSCMRIENAVNGSGGGGVFDAVLRYEELVKYKKAIVFEMLRRCGFQEAQSSLKDSKRGASDGDSYHEDDSAMMESDIDSIFKEDAHKANAELMSSRVDAKGNRISDPVYIRAWERDLLIDMIALHPDVGDPNILLPGTLMVDGDSCCSSTCLPEQ